ncbi:hypothetical protein GCM10011571_25580 [Marinithermofilum abyssi]|uniref:Concentrative nucleoside transporter C-terminal domain-containing protein n=1 Tax=Marinithermofilum abyssi TaxID=1571185 RepID=A0A8J2VJ48_9BACL|nr:hypothetical protein GCM10011571_25580 [Marinithermofilum abyssi]
MKLALNVGALLIAFVGLIALLNGILGGIGDLFGVAGLTLQKVLGYVFAPIAFVIGVPWSEAIQAGSYIGTKMVVAYSALGPHINELSTKTAAIVTFALCGFANFSSIAIQIGTIGGLAPERRRDVPLRHQSVDRRYTGQSLKCGDCGDFDFLRTTSPARTSVSRRVEPIGSLFYK